MRIQAAGAMLRHPVFTADRQKRRGGEGHLFASDLARAEAVSAMR